MSNPPSPISRKGRGRLDWSSQKPLISFLYKAMALRANGCDSPSSDVPVVASCDSARALSGVYFHFGPSNRPDYGGVAWVVWFFTGACRRRTQRRLNGPSSPGACQTGRSESSFGLQRRPRVEYPGRCLLRLMELLGSNSVASNFILFSFVSTGSSIPFFCLPLF